MKPCPKSATASLEIDPQCCFTPLCPEELPVPDGDTIVAALEAQAQWADYRIATKDAHPASAIWTADKENPPGSPLDKPEAKHYWPPHAVPGTLGFKFIPGLPHPTQYNHIIWKGIEPDMHPYGACFHDITETLSTGLIEYLSYQKIRAIIVGGLATDYCVKYTVLQLCKAGFDVLVNLPACRGLDPETTKHAIRSMKEAGALLFTQTETLTKMITRP